MTLITTHEAAVIYKRNPQWFMVLVRMKLVKGKKLSPVMVDADELEAFMRALTPDTIRKIVVYMRTKKEPALPGKPRPGRKPGSGMIKRLGDQKTASGRVAPAGVSSPSRVL